MNHTLVGIALAAYRPNLDIFYAQLISIAEQRFTNWICVVTADSPLREVFADDRFNRFKTENDRRWIWIENEERLGSKKNFEKAINILASDKLVDAIACSDQDDIWYPEKLEICVIELKNAGPLSLVHSDMHIMTSDGKIYSEPGDQTTWQVERRGFKNVSTLDLIVRNVVAGCAMLFDAELARRYPSIPDAIEFHDRWYPLLASFNGGVHAINKTLFAYRQHPKNTLGVTPYTGFFNAKNGQQGKIGVLAACRQRWIESRAISMSLPSDAGNKVKFSRIQLLGLVVRRFFDDPALSRAALARLIGAFWYPSYIERNER